LTRTAAEGAAGGTANPDFREQPRNPTVSVCRRPPSRQSALLLLILITRAAVTRKARVAAGLPHKRESAPLSAGPSVLNREAVAPRAGARPRRMLARPSGFSKWAPASATARAEKRSSRRSGRPDARLSPKPATSSARWSCPRTAVNTRGVLSERRRRFPQVLPDDEGGLRRETHRTAVGGDTSKHRQDC
jgi:hypothetical protein